MFKYIYTTWRFAEKSDTFFVQCPESAQLLHTAGDYLTFGCLKKTEPLTIKAFRRHFVSALRIPKTVSRTTVAKGASYAATLPNTNPAETKSRSDFPIYHLLEIP